MNDFKNRSPYIELCLCRRCASVYYDDPTYWIERAEIFQDELHNIFVRDFDAGTFDKGPQECETIARKIIENLHGREM